MLMSNCSLQSIKYADDFCLLIMYLSISLKSLVIVQVVLLPFPRCNYAIYNDTLAFSILK